jgi:hypothetical protein
MKKSDEKNEHVDIATLEVEELPRPVNEKTAPQETNDKEKNDVAASVSARKSDEQKPKEEKSDNAVAVQDAKKSLEELQKEAIARVENENLHTEKKEIKPVSIDSLIEKEHIADIDLEKEREEAARRAEEELRKAIAAVDQED